MSSPTSHDTDHEITTTRYVGTYRIIKVLGRDGIDEVYLAEDDRDGKRCAQNALRN